MPTPAELATIDQRVQVGQEVTPGTPVAATKIMGDWTAFSVAPSIDVSMLRGMGAKFGLSGIVGKEMTTIAVGGPMTYDSLVYALNAAFKTGVIAAGGDATTRYHTFALSQTAQETYSAMTFEHGDTLRGRQIAGCQMPDWSFTFDLMANSAEWSGSMLGRSLADNTALTGSLTNVTSTAMAPALVDIYMDTTYAGLGTTKLTRCLKADWSMSGHWEPLFTLNSTLARSMAVQVEAAPTVECKLLLEVDAAGMSRLTALRANTSQFLRITCTGPVAGSSTQNFRLDMPCKISAVGPIQDAQGIMAFEITCAAIFDITGAANITLRLENLLTTLA